MIYLPNDGNMYLPKLKGGIRMATNKESRDRVISESRKAELYNEMLGYLVELIHDEAELVHVLKHMGFSDEEIEYEDLNIKE